MTRVEFEEAMEAAIRRDRQKRHVEERSQGPIPQGTRNRMREMREDMAESYSGESQIRREVPRIGRVEPQIQRDEPHIQEEPPID